VKKSLEKFKIYKNVFDEFTLQTLFKLASQDHFDDVVSPVMIGKESNVFLAEKKDGDYVIVKIYRLHSCNFNQMFSYIKSDPRFMNLKNQRRQVIFRWVQREFRNLMAARENINVPTPITFKNNVIVMESIGGDTPAPQLKDSDLIDAQDFADRVINGMFGLIKSGIVHADLSEFNILNLNEKPYFIDFSQATSLNDNYATQYLERDLKNIVKFFKKKKVELDQEKILSDMKKEIIKYL